MPIQRIPVVHKFGIISQSHQGDIRKRLLDAQSQNFQLPSTIARTGDDVNLEKLLYQISIESDEIEVNKLEEKISNNLQKLKYQLSTVGHKNGWNTYQKCWETLSSIINCNCQKVSEASLQLLKNSLCIAPLSKHLVKTLMMIGLTTLQGLLSNDFDNSSPAININLRIQVCWLIFTRLYYHFIANNLDETLVNQLESIHLISRGVKKTLILHDENPTNYVFLDSIIAMVTEINKMIETTESRNETVEYAGVDHDGTKKLSSQDEVVITKLLWNSLKIWKGVSRHLPLESNVCTEILSTDLSKANDDNKNRLANTLSLQILCECATLKIEYLKLFLRLGMKSNYLQHKRKNTSNSKVRSSNRRTHKEIQTNPSIFDKVDDFINPTYTSRKLEGEENKDFKPNENLVHDPRPNINGYTLDNPLQNVSTKTEGKKDLQLQPIWDWILVVIYLNCLAKISFNGLSIEIQKLVLFGDNTLYGLIDYMNCYDGVECWRIRCCSYVYLYELYQRFHLESMKDGLKNAIWISLLKFQQDEKDVRIQRIINQGVFQNSYIMNGSLFSNIATNMAIMVLPPEYMGEKPTPEKKSYGLTESHQLSQFKKKSPKKDRTERIQHSKPSTKILSYEQNSWNNVQRIVAKEYHKEIDEDEQEREKLKREMWKNNEDGDIKH